ncbi:hypothetical protein U1Q18_000739 [Sarracenia purpurea var. burkii]
MVVTPLSTQGWRRRRSRVVGAWRGGGRRRSGGGVGRHRVDARWCAIRSDNDAVAGVGVGDATVMDGLGLGLPPSPLLCIEP